MSAPPPQSKDGVSITTPPLPSSVGLALHLRAIVNNLTDLQTPTVALQVDEMIDNLQKQFAEVSGQVFDKMDELGQRLEQLEKQLGVSKNGS